MNSYLPIAASLVFGVWAVALADSTDWRLTAAPPATPETELNLIGRTVCGEGEFESTGGSVRCRTCPEFTTNAGSDEGLNIGHIIHGRFSSADAVGELLLDTDGCEAHFQNFGSAILLGPAVPKPVLGRPAVMLGSRLSTKPSAGLPTVIFYRPGFRLNDCLVFDSGNTRTMLICNEADIAQGEVIGHISAMEISRRRITRWRLLRWYDNSGTDMTEILSVIPTGIHRLQQDDRQPALEVKLKILEATREAYEKGSEPQVKAINLVFQRKRQRFFATTETQQKLAEINALTSKMLE